MNHSYKLLNIYLDHKQLPSCMPAFVDFSITKVISDISESYNLLDLIYQQRKASGNALLSSKEYSDIAAIINHLDWCKCIIVILDFKSTTPVINALYMKRLLQLFRVLSENYPEIEFAFSCPDEHLRFFTSLIHSVYHDIL